ncbi:serine/threonine-protein kinase [Mycolicibacterium austroafricanum]|uniref:serine/threonine-protein kinase n=1 Tax=Mycolicibacterium austroafricanum TaxID=39687 RepID=UPI001CA30D5B|nr:serine/threonine-protein kinase [Mycolicibacterium austroafricanum]QZT65366.1 serine/threonine protein kinase [Mycolicibacterium austroafricanum]
MFGHYRLTGLLGRGGMGEVYRAEDTRKGRTVALKILAEQYWQDDRFRTRFQRESHAAAILQEPHVIPIHDWGEIDGHPYIDMRLVEGQTLHQLLGRGPLDPARAAFIVSGVAAALDAAHAAGLVHRDIKPQNIILTSSDFPYLVDFGIAEAKGESGLTATGMQVGTLNYMAPERFRDQEVGPAADVYSLACVLYECLTGDAPFPLNSLEQTMTAHLMSPPPRPSAVNRAVPTPFDEVIARGMAKEPDDRYGSCGALGRAAQRALGSGDMVAMASASTMQAPIPQDGVGAPPGNGSPTDARTTDVVPPQYVCAGTPAAPARRSWVMPAALGGIAALLLAGIGIGIVIGMQRGSGGSTEPDTPNPSAQQTVYRTVDPDRSTRASHPAEEPLGVGAPPPPPILGPDGSVNQERCPNGYSLPDSGGPGTHAHRGSPDTSCLFTESVLHAYWSTYGDASRELRQLSARGAVDCRTVLGDGSGCAGESFVMQCAAKRGDAYITCTGGRNAVVYLY